MPQIYEFILNTNTLFIVFHHYFIFFQQIWRVLVFLFVILHSVVGRQGKSTHSRPTEDNNDNITMTKPFEWLTNAKFLDENPFEFWNNGNFCNFALFSPFLIGGVKNLIEWTDWSTDLNFSTCWFGSWNYLGKSKSLTTKKSSYIHSRRVHLHHSSALFTWQAWHSRPLAKTAFFDFLKHSTPS